MTCVNRPLLATSFHPLDKPPNLLLMLLLFRLEIVCFCRHRMVIIRGHDRVSDAEHVERQVPVRLPASPSR